MSDEKMDKAVRRSVGFATLHRLHRMIDADKMQETNQARWATRLVWGFIAAAVLTVAWLAFR